MPADPSRPAIRSADVPASWVERARALSTGELTPATPRDAATVVLLRDGSAGIEAFLLRRVLTMDFAAGMFVFPGGSVDPRDAQLPDAAWHGPPAADWAGLLSGDAALARALVCAAVRETFEESGVLLAGDGPEDVVADISGGEWEQARLALLDRSLSLAELLTSRGLVLRVDLLRAWAHWITPEVEPKRFDTRFFVAALPAGQRPRDVGGESDRAMWIRPGDALDRQERGELALMPPTAFTLGELAAFATVDDVLAAGTRRDVAPVMPQVVVDAEQARLLLPGDDAGAGTA